MRKVMRAVQVLLALAFVVALPHPAKSAAPPTPRGMYRVEDGQFVFTPPKGWRPMPEVEWRRRGFSAGFQKGSDPQASSSYFLIKVRRQKRPPLNTLQSLAAKAVALHDSQDLVDYISKKKHHAKPELYCASHDMFFYIQDYADGASTAVTIMVKRFCENHYVVFHFYCRDGLAVDIAALRSVLNTVKFDRETTSSSLNAAFPASLAAPVQFTVAQRSSPRLSVAHEKIVLTIDDITGGQVMVNLAWEDERPIIAPRSMRVDDAVSFKIEGCNYTLTLKKLTNVLIGTDTAEFELRPDATKDDSSPVSPVRG